MDEQTKLRNKNEQRRANKVESKFPERTKSKFAHLSRTKTPLPCLGWFEKGKLLLKSKVAREDLNFSNKFYSFIADQRNPGKLQDQSGWTHCTF